MSELEDLRRENERLKEILAEVKSAIGGARGLLNIYDSIDSMIARSEPPPLQVHISDGVGARSKVGGP